MKAARWTDLELRQLRYFVTLAEHLHFGRAADVLDLAPSALTMQLQALERSLGVKLVARTKRSVALTAAGKLFLTEARATLTQALRAQLAAQRAGRGELGSLEIAYVISAACAGVVQRLLAEYRRSFPDIRVCLSELESPEQIRLLSEGKLDACIVRTVTGDSETFEALQMLAEPIVIALPQTHRLAPQSAVCARELAQEPFIAPQFQSELGFARHLIAIGDRAGFVAEVGIQTRDFLTALTLVGAGFGIATVPASLQLLQIPGVVYRKLHDVTETSVLSIVFRKNDRSPAVACLREIARGLHRGC